ncbi:MAG: 16S rRNA (uracil(1498)-N(3))-methyltransferase [Alphaproteobacteria bacterium]|nr:16S rRNA (uracil(1498)-N(3))-methyltransferase [Alphaproteobacteria bacterium]
MSKLLPSNPLLKIPKIRLYLDKTLNDKNLGDSKIINSQLEIANNDFDYLVKVMRQKINDKIIVFDGLNGDFIAKIIEIKKKSLTLHILEKVANLKVVPNITLAFAPVKNVRIDFVATKASELGVRNFQPIITHRTIVDKINEERFKANIKEACEQCGRNDFPQIFVIKKLDNLLKENLENKILILCDESGNGKKASEIFSKILPKNDQEIIIFIGPEGGFSIEELTKFYSLKNCFLLNLGPRILRAETAIICSLTLVQEFLGDFNLKANFS